MPEVAPWLVPVLVPALARELVQELPRELVLEVEEALQVLVLLTPLRLEILLLELLPLEHQQWLLQHAPSYHVGPWTLAAAGLMVPKNEDP